MIPYFQFISFQIGSLTIYVWGLFVVLGILVGLWMLKRRDFFEEDRNLNLVIYLMLAGIVGGRLGYVLFYDLQRFLENPVDILKIWEGGMSSFGGFSVAAIVLLIALPMGQKLKYLDILTIPFVITWAIGRIGCFMIHDHLGQLSNFFLAIQFPGGARHDMAFYEILAMILLLVIILAIGHWVSLCFSAVYGKDRGEKFDVVKLKKIPDGLVASIAIIYYSAVRFFLDFLRAADLPNSDPRYFNLTPAQYGSILFFIIGLAIFVKCFKINNQKIFTSSSL